MSKNLPYPEMWQMLKDHLLEIVNFFIKYNKDEKIWKYVLKALEYIEDEPIWDNYNSFGFMYGVCYCLNKLSSLEEDAETEKREKDKYIAPPYEDFLVSVKRLLRESLEE